MRELGFSVMWDKLNQPELTTFRLPRRDRDWRIGERVRCMFRPRSSLRRYLFIADIINVESRCFDPAIAPAITDSEAKGDGFDDAVAMQTWMAKAHKGFNPSHVFNKITLRKVTDTMAFEGPL